MVVEVMNDKETWELGRKLGMQAKAGQVYALNGDLGTGKTVLTQGFACGLEITEYVNSPTFTILQIYEQGRLPLYHFDVYRIGDLEEMEEIGYEDFFYGDGVSLVEWAGQVQDILPPEHIAVTIEKDLEKSADYRRITIKQAGGGNEDFSLG